MDDYSHYLFTPRDLTNWCLSLLRYDLNAGAKEGSSDHLLEIWAYEARRLFRDKIVGSDGLNKFDSILMSVIRSDWSTNIFDNLESKCFVLMDTVNLQTYTHIKITGICSINTYSDFPQYGGILLLQDLFILKMIITFIFR